ncbi:MAG: ferrochelatase [Acidimicrobiia bacterium]
MNVDRTGVLVMAYGTPASRADVADYYTRIRHGRPPSAEQLDDLVRRYDAIGGISPLAQRTDAQIRALAAELERRHPGGFDVRLGTKYADPSIEDTAAGFMRDGIERVVGLVLAPHGSSMSTGEYFARARAALGDAILVPIPHWYDAPGFDRLLAGRVHAAMASLPAPPHDTLVIFTAHSLPARILDEGDTYPEQVADSAAAVAAAAGIDRFEVAWQSAARTPEPWIGPDILEVLGGLPGRGVDRVVICPIGFVSEHLEVRYDIDIAAREVADAHGVAMVRTRSLDDDPAFIALLASVTEDAA